MLRAHLGSALRMPALPLDLSGVHPGEPAHILQGLDGRGHGAARGSTALALSLPSEAITGGVPPASKS